MIVHVALFRWRKGVSEGEVEKSLADVRKLKKKCSGVIDIMCGRNFSPHAKEFTHAVVVIAKDRDALDGYRTHPAHKTVAGKIERMEEDGIGFDFEA